MKKEIICIMCPNGCRITAEEKPDGGFDLQGYKCKKGRNYAKKELTAPVRVLTAVMASDYEGRPVPVRSDRPVPKEMMRDLARRCLEEKAVLPVSIGKVIIPDILGTGVNMIATRSVGLP